MFNGYVLHTLAYKETSLIVKFFTKEHGVVSLVAKGAKRKKSPFYNILQPFLPLLIYWENKNMDLHILHKAEAQGAPYKFNRIELFSALYVNELLIKLLVLQDPAADLFIHYKNFLECLVELSGQDKSLEQNLLLEQNLRFIEKQILKAIGYELPLDRESSSEHEINIEAEYCFDTENGLNVTNIRSHSNSIIPCSVGSSQQPCKQQVTLHNKAVISGKSLLALHRNNFTDMVEMQESKQFMRKVIANFLGNKQLISRKLFL
jgi:DNA repair protein RecO (recombination protein O)